MVTTTVISKTITLRRKALKISSLDGYTVIDIEEERFWSPNLIFAMVHPKTGEKYAFPVCSHTIAKNLPAFAPELKSSTEYVQPYKFAHSDFTHKCKVFTIKKWFDPDCMRNYLHSVHRETVAATFYVAFTLRRIAEYFKDDHFIVKIDKYILKNVCPENCVQAYFRLNAKTDAYERAAQLKSLCKDIMKMMDLEKLFQVLSLFTNNVTTVNGETDPGIWVWYNIIEDWSIYHQRAKCLEILFHVVDFQEYSDEDRLVFYQELVIILSSQDIPCLPRIYRKLFEVTPVSEEHIAKELSELKIERIHSDPEFTELPL